MGKILVTGAGGFIGGHLVRDLVNRGFEVRAVDVKNVGSWYQFNEESENIVADLRSLEQCKTVSKNVDQVFNLAADMGGMGFIESNKAACMKSVLINTHLLEQAVENGVRRFFFSSSACVYAHDKQTDPRNLGLKESDAYPAMPEDGYGWEKLFSERMCRHFLEDFGLETRVARYHNVYGPHGTWDGGREKAPAAICRKIALAKITGNKNIEIWGDGEQSRSFTYIEDCIKGTIEIMSGNHAEPVNLGSSEMVTINELVGLVEEIAGIKVERNYNKKAPQGVRGRNSDNSEFVSRYGWQPKISLRQGLEKTYSWIYDEISRNSSAREK